MLLRGISFAIAGSVFALAALSTEPQGSGPVPRARAARAPSVPQRVWRSMRIAWTFTPASAGGSSSRISDLLDRGDRLFYTCGSEAGCVRKSTGRLVWRYKFVSGKHSNSNTLPEYDWCKLAADDRHVYTIDGQWSGDEKRSVYHLRALKLDSGRLAWVRRLKVGGWSAPYPAGSLLLAPLDDGTILAVNRSDGKTVWHRRITNRGAQSTTVVVKVSGKIAVVQIGDGRISAFRIRDGEPIWSYPKSNSSQDDGNSGGPAVRDGVVYALLSESELVALDAASGRLIWKRRTNGSGTPSPAVFSIGENIVTSPFGSLVAVRRSDGRTAWVGEPRVDEPLRTGPMFLLLSYGNRGLHESGQTLLEVRASLPLVGGRQKDMRSLHSLDTLVMLDPSTGRERWRWQPHDGLRIDKIVTDRHRFFVSDGASLRAVEPGLPDPLPVELTRRRRLADQMVLALFRWDRKNARTIWDPAVISSQLSPREPPAGDEAKLILLRLGKNSTPALLDVLRHELADRDNRLPDPDKVSYRIMSFPDSLSDALNLLTDIADYSCVPMLIQELGRAKHPVSRKLVAEALIRLGDDRAVPALFRYARKSPNDADARQDALYMVCKRARVSPLANEVTAYLLARLTDISAPAWLRLFARFELLNNRGEKAREAALASFARQSGSELLPTTKTDEEGIFQAAVEALCQAGRLMPGGADGMNVLRPNRFGGSREPLVLALPQGSARISVAGHLGPLVTRSVTIEHAIRSGLMGRTMVSDNFTRPHIDLGGVYCGPDEPWRSLFGSGTDPFVSDSERVESTARDQSRVFKDYFPYVRSADGYRARVGWTQRKQDVRANETGFDIEVRKIGGRWYPVEFRRVYGQYGLSGDEAVISCVPEGKVR